MLPKRQKVDEGQLSSQHRYVSRNISSSTCYTIHCFPSCRRHSDLSSDTMESSVLGLIWKSRMRMNHVLWWMNESSTYCKPAVFSSRWCTSVPTGDGTVAFLDGMRLISASVAVFARSWHHWSFTSENKDGHFPRSKPQIRWDKQTGSAKMLGPAHVNPLPLKSEMTCLLSIVYTAVQQKYGNRTVYQISWTVKRTSSVWLWMLPYFISYRGI